MAIEYTPESNLVSDPAEGGSFSPSNDAELAGAQSFAAQAKLSETAAATSATNAATSETNASNSASAAATSATESATSATASATSATQSATSATASANSATAAATAETNAATSATNASNSATAAATSATNAATSETNAATSATAASNSATSAATSATNAATSETNAANSATAAATSATNAATSATAASNSATAASTSATAAATSETNAANSATAAATSATNAATSATAAANSATASATSATASAGSATNASNSATSAATAQTAAESARDAALAAFDSFDDRYLGQKSSDPSTDNDGNTLLAGTLYFNTTDDTMKVYEGSTWVAAYASLSGALIANNNLSDLNNAATARTNLGLGTIATAAATDYVPVTGGTFTGNVESPEFIGTLQGEMVFKAKAGEAISKGDAVYVSGISGTTPVVSKADANDSSKMPAFGLSADTVSTNAAMEVVILGQLTNIDTSSYSLGDTLYISDTPGVLSATKPTGESSQLQNIGKVERVHATTGSILVSGSGRSAATPNLNDGNFFLGNSSNQSVSTDFTTAVLGEISAGTGIGISGSGVISNSAPDQTVSLTGAGATSISGTYPNFTITSTDNNTTYTAGTGITLTGTEFSIGQDVATTASPTFASINVNGLLTSDDLQIDLGTSTAAVEITTPSSLTGFNAFSIKNTSTEGYLKFGTANGQARIQALGAMGSADPLDIDVGNITAIGIAADGVITIPNTLQFDTSWNEPAIRFGSDAPFVRSDGQYVYWDGNGTSSLYYINGFGGITTDSKVTITDDDGLVVRSSTNGVGASIEFSDHAGGSYQQKGTLTYYHADGSSYGSGNAFVFEGSEITTSVVGHKAVFENFLVKPSSGTGAGTLLVDSSRNITANYVKADRLYANDDGSTGYFFNDSGTRVAYTGGDFYIQSGVNYYYNYATNQYLGNTSGDTIYLRGNRMVHNGWDAEAAGHFRLFDNKYLKIGSGSDVEHFWNGSNYYTDINGGAVWYIRDGNSSNASRFMMDVDNGNFHADGNIYAYSTSVSDEKLKKDITKVENALDKVSQLNGYEFTYLKDNKRSAGVIAQEVEKVLPQAVGEDELMHLEGDNEKYKYVEYDQLVALLIESIKELKAEVEELKGDK